MRHITSILLLSLVLLTVISIPVEASDFGYNNPTLPKLNSAVPTTSGSINVSGESVNDSYYLRGLTPQQVADLKVESDPRWNANSSLVGYLANNNTWNGTNKYNDYVILSTSNIYTYYDYSRTVSTTEGVNKMNANLAEITASPATWGGSVMDSTDRLELSENDSSRTDLFVEASSTYHGIMTTFHMPDDIPASDYTKLYAQAIGYLDTDWGLSSSQWGLYIWNANSFSWVQVGSTVSGATDQDVHAEIATDVSDYIDANGDIHLLIRNPLASSGDGKYQMNYIRIGWQADVTVTSDNYGGNFNVAGDLTYGKMFTARDIIPQADSTYNLGSELKRWQGVYSDNLDSVNLSIGNQYHTYSEEYDILFNHQTDKYSIIEAYLVGTSQYGTTGLNLNTLTDVTPTDGESTIVYGLMSTTKYNGNNDGGGSGNLIGAVGTSSLGIFEMDTDSATLTTTKTHYLMGGQFGAAIYELGDGFTGFNANLNAVSLYAQAPAVSVASGRTLKTLAALFADDTQIQSGKKLILDGSGAPSASLVKGDTYMIHSASTNILSTYVEGTQALMVDRNHTLNFTAGSKNWEMRLSGDGRLDIYNGSGLGTARAKQWLTSTYAYDFEKEGNPLDKLDNYLTIAQDGQIDSSKYFSYQMCPVPDKSRPVEVSVEVPECTEKLVEIKGKNYSRAVCVNVTITDTIYPYTIDEPCHDLDMEGQLALAALATYKTAITVPEDGVIEGNTSMWESIYTKSKVPDPAVNYCKMIMDADIYNKSNHYAYKEVNGRFVLDAEYRWVVLEGCEKQKLAELCSDKKYSWCPK